MIKKILAIGAHPDDMEQFAGGTLILLRQNGHNITIAAMTRGECGSKTATPEEIVEIRDKEARKAAEIIGARYTNLGLRDGSVEYSLENVRKVVALIREIRPDIIITHPAKDDYMADHWHTGALVLWAIAESYHPNFDAPTAASAPDKWPHLYHTDPQGLMFSDGQIARVNTIVDITGVIEQKLTAFSAHESQMGFLSHKQKPDAAEKTRRWAITRGEQARVGYAEGFMQQLSAEYPRNNILIEMLPKHVFTL